MDEIASLFIEIFKVLVPSDPKKCPSNEELAQATEACEELLKSADSIYGLIHVLNTSQNTKYKNSATIFLHQCIQTHLKEIEDKNSIVEKCLEILLTEKDYDIQRSIVNSIDEIMTDSASSVVGFAQNALQSQAASQINAAILLCNKIIIEIDDFSECLKIFIDLITVGIQKLSLINPLEFAFNLGLIIDSDDDSETDPFFSQMWEESINYVCQNIENQEIVKSIIELLNDSMDGEIPKYVNPALIMDRFFPLLGDTNISLLVNVYLNSAINSALEIVGVIDGVNVEEFFPEYLQKLMQISAMAYNPDDSLSISYTDLIFEDCCLAFSSSELDTSDLFIETVLSKVEEFYPHQETKAGCIIAIGYVVGEGTDIIIGSLPQICQLLVETVNNESKLVRDCAAFAISELSKTLEEEIEDYFEDLANAMLKSLEKEVTQDMILSFKELLLSAKDTDPIFETAYNFLMQKMSSCHEEWLHYFFPCLSELCIRSKKNIKGVFEQLISTVFSAVDQGSSEDLLSHAIHCLAYLSESFPELFAQYVPKLVEIIVPLLKSESEVLVTDSLLSFGKLIGNHSDQLSSIIPQLIPELLEIGSQDASIDLVKEIADKEEQLNQLKENGETEFEVDEEEEDDEKLSPYAIPSLALSVFSKIALKFPSIVPENLERVMNEINTQMKNHNQDAIIQICQTISQLSRAISKVDIPLESKSQVAVQFCSWINDDINNVLNKDACSKAMETAGQIIELFGVKLIGEENLENLIKIIDKALNNKLKCQKDNEIKNEFYDQFCLMTCELIASLGLDAPEALAPLVPKFFDFATSKKVHLRDISIQLFGQLVEHSSENISNDTKENIYKLVLNGIRQNSQHAAFALNQFTNNDGSIILQSIESLMELIYEKLENLSQKKSITAVAFVDNLVAALGEIRRNVLKDQFPLEQFAPICLSLMPAREDISTNYDMMVFYLFMAKEMNKEPPNVFASVAIKLLMQPKSEIGGIGENDVMLKKVASVMIECFEKMGQEAAEALIDSVCDSDEFKMQRIQNALSSVQ